MQIRGTLICTHCLKECGKRRVKAVIKVAGCKSRRFGNKDGKLFCDKFSMPTGTFVNSCNACEVDGEYLECKVCSTTGDIPAVHVRAKLGECHSFSNVNGELVCDSDPSLDL